ncbi:MAG: radical SAM protein [Candidatus Omnitrophica bacterium]|nr:radical SAM protein [Candidatus Omnitrophota bacterium]
MKTQAYHKFWHNLHDKAKDRGLPLRVLFELTYGCNFKCRHCYVPQSYKRKILQELKTGNVISMLEQLADSGCFHLGFSGGEPFIRKDALKILKYAKRKGFNIIIYTNGSLINEKIAGELQQLNPNKVDITIPSLKQGVFERITGIKGSYAKVFRAIELLDKNKIALGFKTCLLKENETEIAAIEKFAASLNAEHRLDDRLSRRLNGSDEPFKYRAYPKVYTGGYYPVHEKTTPRLFTCGAGKTQAAITPFGELKICTLIDYPKYKISESSFESCWDKLKTLVKSIGVDEYYKCAGCSLSPYCKWCPAVSWLYDRTFTSCDPQIRKWAKIKKQNYGKRN